MRARTSRNSRFIFGPAVWLRSLIKPPPGYAASYVDWSQQEFGIAAALSGDQAMMDAYRSGDPYLAFAKQAGAVPPDATKASHASVRELYETTALAVQDGMEAESLAARIGQPSEIGVAWPISFGWHIGALPKRRARAEMQFPSQSTCVHQRPLSADRCA